MEQRFEHLMVPAMVGQAPFRLIEYQKDGWELVAVTVTADDNMGNTLFFFFFKRPIEHAEPKERAPDPGYN